MSAEVGYRLEDVLATTWRRLDTAAVNQCAPRRYGDLYRLVERLEGVNLEGRATAMRCNSSCFRTRATRVAAVGRSIRRLECR